MLCCDSKKQVIGTLPGKIENLQGMVSVELMDEVETSTVLNQHHQFNVPMLTRQRFNLPVFHVQRMCAVSEREVMIAGIQYIAHQPAESFLAQLASKGLIPIDFLTFVEMSNHISIRQDFQDQDFIFTFTATQFLAEVSDDLSEMVFDLPQFEPM